MPPKRGTSTARSTAAATKKAAAAAAEDTPTTSKAAAASSSARTTAAATAAARKREHQAGGSGESPVKKREARKDEDADNRRILMCGFKPAEISNARALLPAGWTIEETLSSEVSHVVIKSMGAITTKRQLLPIFWAVLKGVWLLRQSFLPASKRKSGVGPTPLKDEKSHEYDGKELDAALKAKPDFPSINEIVAIQRRVRSGKADGEPAFFASDPFQKVVILADKNKDSRQRREYVKLMMEAGGATVVDDDFWEEWKEEKRGNNRPTMVVLVNGVSSPSSVGCDRNCIRALLKARSLIFYEEYITQIITYNCSRALEDLLQTLFVFVHENWADVDPKGKLQERVMGRLERGEDAEGGESTEEDEEAPLPHSSRNSRANSRLGSATREVKEREEKKKKEVKKEKKDEAKKEIKEEAAEETPPKRAKKAVGVRGRKESEAEKDTEDGDDELSRESVHAAPSVSVKRGRGRPRKEVAKIDEETPKIPRKEVKAPLKGRAKKGETADREEEKKKEEEEEEEEDKKEAERKIKTTKKEEEKKRKKEVKKKGKAEEAMDVDDDIDPELAAAADGGLLEEFEMEIEQRSRGGGRGRRRVERTEEEMRELREMREDRGDEDDEEENDSDFPLTPEPIQFSQLETQPEIEIPEALRRALETREEDEDEEDNLSKKAKNASKVEKKPKNEKKQKKDEVAAERDEMEWMREEMNEEIGRQRRTPSPHGYEAASEYGMKSVAPITIDEAKECETCNHMGTQSLYINQQSGGEIEKHFAAPRIEWMDSIADVKETMPWIKEGKVLRPARKEDAAKMDYQSVDFFNSYYHELDDDLALSTVLMDLKSSNAMQMYEGEWEENEWRRPPVDIMVHLLHEFAVKRRAMNLFVPSRACCYLRKAVPLTLPSSAYGRNYWLTVMAGGDKADARGGVLDEQARRYRTFLTRALLSVGDAFPLCVSRFAVYLAEVDLLCAQTPVVEYDLEPLVRQREEMSDDEESMDSQTTNGSKRGENKDSLECFPLILLLVIELDEQPRRGLSESGVIMVQKLLDHLVTLKQKGKWGAAGCLGRGVLCLLEAVRWHCCKGAAAAASAATTALSAAERRRVKQACSQQQGEDAAAAAPATPIPIELRQNIQRITRRMVDQGLRKAEVLEMLKLAWLEEIIHEMD